MKRILYFLACILLISCGSSSESMQEPTPEEPTPQEPFERLFYAFNFGGLQNLTPQEQITLLKDSGYDGITLSVGSQADEDLLAEFIQIADNTPDFKIYSVLARYRFDIDEGLEVEVEQTIWKRVVDAIKGRDIDMWFAFLNDSAGRLESEVEPIMTEIANYSFDNGVPLVLYPHDNTFYESAMDVLPFVQEINNPHLTLAVHTNHELKDGRGVELGNVVRAVKDYLSVITFSGASAIVDLSNNRTKNATTIRPIEDNEFDYSDFYAALNEIDYKNPVIFMNFQIESNYNLDPVDYMPTSLEAWKTIERKFLN